jgi:hypothetical protein
MLKGCRIKAKTNWNNGEVEQSRAQRVETYKQIELHKKGVRQSRAGTMQK